MESIISSLQSIPKPSFLRTNRQTTEQKQPSEPPNNNDNNVSNTSIHINPLPQLNNMTSTSQSTQSTTQYKIDLPTISFTDFSEWDLMPYNELFIRDRLRYRIEQNKKEYAKHGIIAQSVPLKLEIKSIQDILLSGGTVSELRMNKNASKLSVILSYSKMKARPVTKLISEINDNELTQIISRYNNLRRTTLINQPCLLCGIYDIYFLQLIISIINKTNIKYIQQRLMQFLTKSLIYCLIGLHNNDNNIININLTRDTTLDILNYESIHTLLMCISNCCHICFNCMKRYKLYHNKNININYKKWYSELLDILMNHGLNLNKVIKNSSLRYETALMNIYNCEWLDLKQFLLINLMFQPFEINEYLKNDYVNKWFEFNDNLLMQYNEMYLKCENIKNNKTFNDYGMNKQNELIKLKQECNRFALETQLTIFESFLKTFINDKYLYQMIDYLYNNIIKKQINLIEYDILIILLFCGHLNGYKYMFKILSQNNNKLLQYNKILLTNQILRIYKIFESFDELLSITNIIPSNLKDIGKIIAIKACLFHYKFTKKYNNNIDQNLRNKKKFEFIQCLKILFYDYGLYDFDTDKIHWKMDHKHRRKYKKKLPQSIINKDEEINNDNNNNNNMYVDIISMGLKTQKKFLMECGFLDVDILQCLMELKLIDETFIVDRFRNVFDFIDYEMKINVEMIWYKLQNKVFLYNKNVFLLRTMKEKDLKLLFRRVIRVAVSKEYRIWVNEFIMNGDKISIDKNIQIKKRAEIEDKYKLPNNAVLLIRQYV